MLNLKIIKLIRGGSPEEIKGEDSNLPIISPSVKAVFLRAMIDGAVMSKKEIRVTSSGISTNLVAVCVRYFSRKNMLVEHETKNIKHPKYSLKNKAEAIEAAEKYELEVYNSKFETAKREINNQLETSGHVRRSTMLSSLDCSTSTLDKILANIVNRGATRIKDGRDVVISLPTS